MTIHPEVAALLGDKEPTSAVEKRTRDFILSLPQDKLAGALAKFRQDIKAEVAAMLRGEREDQR